MNLGQLIGELRVAAGLYDDGVALRHCRKRKARAHPTRDRVVAFLRTQTQPLTLSEIAARMAMDPGTMHHALTDAVYCNEVVRSGAPHHWRYAASVLT